MRRLLPRPRAAARQLTRTAADSWRPPASSSSSSSTSSAAFLSTTRVHNAAGSGFVQAHPRTAYYDVLLTPQRPPYDATKPEEPPVSALLDPAEAAGADPGATTKADPVAPPNTSAALDSASPASSAAAQPVAAATTAKERARIVFGSRLAGPIERASRLAELRQRSVRIAGVLVPPRPEEPDNCCMSGCVNCVWDRYRDEMEAWAAASAEASRRLKAQEGGVAAGVDGSKQQAPQTTAAGHVSMDDDGGGSDTNWSLAETSRSKDGGWDEELYKDVPVGIREFMRQEKRLKLKHLREGTVGG